MTSSGNGTGSGRLGDAPADHEPAAESGSLTLAPRIESVRSQLGGRTSARGDQTRERIVAEAARCVLEEGFAAASANHIAQRSGVTWGVIQYHFGDRAGLLSAVVQAGYDEFCAVLDTAVLEDGTVREQVESVVDLGWRAFSSPLGRASMEILVNTRASRASDPDHAARLVDMARGLHRLLDRTFPPHLAGPEGAAIRTVVWAALRGFVLSYLMAPTDYDFRAERQMLVDLVVTQIEATSRTPGPGPTPAPGPGAGPQPQSDAPDPPDRARSAQP